MVKIHVCWTTLDYSKTTTTFPNYYYHWSAGVGRSEIESLILLTKKPNTAPRLSAKVSGRSNTPFQTQSFLFKHNFSSFKLEFSGFFFFKLANYILGKAKTGNLV